MSCAQNNKRLGLGNISKSSTVITVILMINDENDAAYSY